VPRSLTFLWQRATTVTVSWFAGANGKITRSGITYCLNYCTVSIVHGFCSTVHECGRGTHNTTSQAAVWTPMGLCISKVKSPCVIKRGEHVWERGSIAKLTPGRGLDGYMWQFRVPAALTSVESPPVLGS
jgi:hypothetical protein